MYEFDAREHKAHIIQWIREKFNTYGNDKNAVIAISGGKDSSIVAALCVEALGKDRVKGILLPNHIQDDIDCSLILVKALGIDYKIVNIGPTFDSIIEENRKSGIEPTTQAKNNLAARLRMVETFYYAQTCNGMPSCNSNLSECYIGWSTYGGDGFGSFAPLKDYTVTEVRQIGLACPFLPQGLVLKTPKDGLTDKSDEDNFGFSYEKDLDPYIRTGEISDMEIKAKIDRMHKENQFKQEPVAKCESGLPILGKMPPKTIDITSVNEHEVYTPPMFR